jgi:uncharacterized protein YkwD
MIQKHITTMIAPVAIAGILILAVLTAIPSNALMTHSSSEYEKCVKSSNNCFLLNNGSSNAGNGATSQESSNAGNAQESSNTGTCNKIFCENLPQKQESSNAGNAQESSNTGSAQQESSNTGNAAQGASNNGNTADIANTILDIHNRERAAHSIPPLKWSDELAAEAKTWAEHLATTGKFEHETSIFPAKGENIAQGAAGFHSTEQLIQGWVDEKNKIQNPVTDQNLYPVGHYVQMVSPATTHVGCATASGGGKVDLVCRYDRSLAGQEPYIPSFLSRPAG